VPVDQPAVESHKVGHHPLPRPLRRRAAGDRGERRAHYEGGRVAAADADRAIEGVAAEAGIVVAAGGDLRSKRSKREREGDILGGGEIEGQGPDAARSAFEKLVDEARTNIYNSQDLKGWYSDSVARGLLGVVSLQVRGVCREPTVSTWISFSIAAALPPSYSQGL
jgi:hypothetical protein